MDDQDYIRTSLEQQQKPASSFRTTLVVPAYVAENIANGAVVLALGDFKKRFADWLAEQGYAWTANALRDGSWEKKS